MHSLHEGYKKNAYRFYRVCQVVHLSVCKFQLENRWDTMVTMVTTFLFATMFTVVTLVTLTPISCL